MNYLRYYYIMLPLDHTKYVLTSIIRAASYSIEYHLFRAISQDLRRYKLY